MAGATGKVRWYFLLDNSQGKPGERAEFYCGIFNSNDRISFSFPQLPPAHFAVVVQDTTGGKLPYMLTWILQNANNQWRIAGLIPKPATIAGKTGLDYWKEALQGLGPLDLPADYPRPPVPSYRGGRHDFRANTGRISHVTLSPCCCV